MANHWIFSSRDVDFTSRVVLADIFNAGSAVLKVYRVFALDSNFQNVAGQLGMLHLARTTSVRQAASGAGKSMFEMGASLTNATKPARLPDGLSAWYNRAVVTSDIFRRVIWNSDDVAGVAVRAATWEMTLEVGQIWEAGTRDAAVQPLTFRNGYGIALADIENTFSAGTVDVYIEATTE